MSEKILKKLDSDEKKDWLVKASSKVLGPFVFEDIHQLLKSKAITFVDEVRRSDQRWFLIKEHRDFVAIVQSLRFEHDAGELTMTSAMTKTDQQTLTDQIANIRDEMTPTPFVGTHPTFQSHNEEIKDVHPIRENSGYQRPSHLTGKAFGLRDDLRLQQTIETKSSRWRLVLISLVVFSILGIVGYQYLQNQKKNLDFERYSKLAVRYKTLQLYDRALVEYKNAKSIKDKEPEFSVQAQMAPLLIAIQGDTLVGRRILEKSVLTPNASKNQMVEDYVGIALAFLAEGNLKEAEQNLNNALSFDHSHLAANLNLIWIKYSQRMYSEALTLIDSLQLPPQGMLALAEALIVNEMPQGPMTNNQIDLVLQKLLLAQKSSQNLKPELLLMIIHLQQKRNGVDASIPAMKNLLDEPQNVQNYFVQDPLIYKKWLDFSQWEKICQEFQSRSQTSLLTKITAANCYENFNKETEAGKILDEVQKQAPNDPYGLLQELTLSIKLNKSQEASVLMRKAELHDFKLPLWHQGKICLEREDLSCAQNSFKSILDKKPADIFARGGLASVYYKLGQKNEALSAIRAGLSDEPQFLPLLELRDVLESQ